MTSRKAGRDRPRLVAVGPKHRPRDQDLYTIEELAALLEVSSRTLERRVSTGDLVAVAMRGTAKLYALPVVPAGEVEPLLGLLTTKEAAAGLAVTESTVRRWVRIGLLKPHSMQGVSPLYLARDLVQARKSAQGAAVP